MKQSAKAKRIRRHQRRNQAVSKLNLVSLMDIFTILVFFLMVNSSSDVQVLNRDNKISLPVSKSDTVPEDAITITVSDTSIIVSGREVVTREEFDQFEGNVEPALRTELSYLANRAGTSSSDLSEQQPKTVTILAAKDLPYAFLQKLMSTCVDAGYGNIALAVKTQAGADT